MNTLEIYSLLPLLIILLSYVSLSSAWNPFSKRSAYLKSEDKSNSYRLPENVECKIYDLKIVNCNIKVSRLGNQRIGVSYKKTCNLKSTSFLFSFGMEGEYSSFSTKNKPEIRINEIKKQLEDEKKFLLTGTHYIKVGLKAVTLKNKEMALDSDRCSFYVEHEKPTPSLGRINKNVKDGEPFVVNAGGSINNDIGKKNVGLEYKWSCEDTVGFCEGRDLGTGSTVVVDEEFAKLGANFTFTVEVRTQYSEWQKFQQFIYVDPSRPFAINCISQCGKEPNKFDALGGALVIAECQFDCEQYDKNKTRGIITYIDDPGSDIVVHPFASALIRMSSVKSNRRIRVTGYYGEKRTIIGLQEFSTYPRPRLENCKAIPASGNPLTKFKFECSYDKDQAINFEIQVESQGTVVFSTSSEKLEDIEFVIPSVSTVTVKLRDINGVEVTQKVQVKIDPLVKDTSNITNVNEHLNDIFEGKREGSGNVDNLISEGNFTNAVQIINVVARELSSVPIKGQEGKKIVENLRKKLLNSLSELPVENVDMLKSVSGVISLIANQHKDNISESKMAKQLGKLCSEVAKKQLYILENDIGNDIQEKDVVGTTDNLLGCGESEMAPYYKIFEDVALDIEITTEYPIRAELSENNIEEYPEYVADDLIEDQMHNFIKAAEYVVDICRDLGKSLILATSLYDEKPTYVEREDTIIGVFKSTGMKIAGSKFLQHNVTVTVSSYMEKIDSIFSVRVCSYKHDPFWSISKTLKIDTNVVDISITDMADEREIAQFGTKPTNISFTVVKNNAEKKIIKSFDFLNHIVTDYPEENFNIFIFKTKAMESFMVEFYDLGEFDGISAVLTDMERPVLHHFSIAYTITKINNKLLIENQFDEDKWFLLGLMSKNNESLKKTFKISVYTIKCVTWDYSTSSWKHACSIYTSTTNEMIHCRCLHLSTLAGYLEYYDIKEHPKFVAVKFALEDNKSLHIGIMVCITVFTYFALVVYAIKKMESMEDAVYFLSDIPSRNRYCYLMSIRTGRKLDSGTTSDIAIQIFGTAGKSQEHVLNFPDPFLELLQRNQNDMFVLATPKHLGKLLKIHIWFDFTGTSPNWYCNEVKICDLQKKRWYVFKVKKWLKVDGNPKVFLNVRVSGSIRQSKNKYAIQNRLKRIFSTLGQFRNTLFSPPANSENRSFGLPKRITLILSIVLTLMSILILFHGKPERMLRDSITANCYYELDWNILYFGIYTAIITFVPHTALMVGFKKSRLQYDNPSAKKFPFVLTMSCWGILIFNIFIQIHFLLIYGYWFIAPTTWLWTTSLLVALLFYIFVLDYIYHIILMTADSAMQHGKMNYNKILRNVEYQRKYLYSSFGQNICRPIMTPLYEVMNGADYLKKYVYFLQKHEVWCQMQDLAMIIFFIFFLYVIIMEERDTTYDVLAHKEAMILLKGHENFRLKLSRVNDMKEFEAFMERTFIPNLQSYQWYGRYLSESPGMTTDACNRYLGIIRIRQLRSELIPCNITTDMKFINRTCSAIGYVSHFDYLNYTPSWNETIPEHHQSRLGYVWGYQDTTGESHFGVSGHYEQGGYIALLGRTMKNSLVNIEYLRRYGWMNLLTRAIFIELPFYNVNMNLFNFATVMLEKTPSGYIYKRAKVTSLRILTDTTQSTTVSSIFSLLFIGLTFLITVRTYLRIMKTKEWSKRDLWNVVDVGIISLSITWIVMYFKRINLLKYFVKELEEKRSNSFVDYFDIMGVESWLRIVARILICAITLRIWRLLRFATVFRTVERTLAYSFESLMYCFAYFFIYCIGFGIWGFVLFCTASDKFKDGLSTSKTLILMTIGLRGPKILHLDEKNSSLGYAYIVIFYWFTYFLTTILIAIILVNFLKAQQFTFEEISEYNMKDYTKDKIESFKWLARMWVRKFRLKAGANKTGEEEVVTPKSNDVRYLNCVSVDSNRMRAMKSVAKCVLSKRTKGLMFNESDHAQMMKAVRHLCNRKKGKDEFFFKQDNKISGCSLIDDRRILMIEEVVKRMLESPQKRAARLKIIEENEILRAENTAKLEEMNYRLKSMLKVLSEITVKIETR